MSQQQVQGQNRLTSIATALLTFLQYLKSFKWVVDIARWIQDTGATIAESAFTLAIIYVIIFTFGHLLIVWIPENITNVTNQIVMIIFTVLPELVMIPILLTTSDHWSMARRTRDRKSYGWFIAYAALTCLFITLTLILLSSLQSGIKENTTQNTGALFILRCFSGLSYTIIQRLWDGKGKENYTSQFDRLTQALETLRQQSTDALANLTGQKDKALDDLRREKDRALVTLRTEKDEALEKLRAEMQARLIKLEGEYQESLRIISEQHEALKSQASRVNGLELLVNKSSDSALEAYGEECQNWLNGESSHFLISEISRYTGHSWQKIRAALKAGNLEKPRGRLKDRDDRVSRDSLIPWLIDNVPMEQNTDDIPVIHAVK